MREKLPLIAGGLLGLAFFTFGLNHFLNFIPMPEEGSPAGSPQALFFGAIYPISFRTQTNPTDPRFP